MSLGSMMMRQEQVQINPLDVEAAKARFADYSGKIQEMETTAKTHEVNDDQTNHQAVAMATQSKRLFKMLEDLRKEVTAPALSFKRDVDGFCKVFTAQLKGIEDHLKAKINAYQIEQERIRRAAEAKARAEAEKLRKEQEKEAEKARQKALKAGTDPALIEDPVIVEPVIPESKPAVVRTESGSASLRKVWTWEPVSFADVPDDFKALDTKKINAAVKDGVRNIPGIKIFEKQTTVLR